MAGRELVKPIALFDNVQSRSSKRGRAFRGARLDDTLEHRKGTLSTNSTAPTVSAMSPNKPKLHEYRMYGVP